MKIKKYIKKMTAQLNVEKRKSNSQKKYIKIILGELKNREILLKEEIANTTDADKQQQLNEELKVVHHQRKKGVKALYEIKKEK